MHSPRRSIPQVLLIVTFLTLVGTAKAAEDPMDFYRNAPIISIVTMGPGEAAFYKFGHNAIRVRDIEGKTDRVYNFGTFRFGGSGMILDFLTGKFDYWLGVVSFRSTLKHYKREDRDIDEQVLALSATHARALNKALIENAKEENRYYKYDYYLDNCSTRVRDTLNDAMEGRFGKRFQDPGRLTFREHTLRAVADNMWLYLGLDIAMGSFIDRPLTRWEEMFLPEELARGIDSVSHSGVHGSARLVKSAQKWYETRGRKDIRRHPPERTRGFLKFSCALGALLAFLGWDGARRRLRWARWTFSLATGLAGLVLGTLGLLFCLLWAFTDHEVAYANENILQCAPWALGLVVCVPGMMSNSEKWTRWARNLLAASAGVALVGFGLKLLPAMSQQNYRIIALLLPLWLGLALGSQFLLHTLQRDRQRALRQASEGSRATERDSKDRTEGDAAAALG